MGVFDKIIGKIGNTFLKKSIIEHYNRFLAAQGEFDETVLECLDINYSITIVNDFMSKYQLHGEGEDYGFCDFCRLQFEECIFEIYMFKHYARGLTISVVHELDENCNLAEVCRICNAINAVDLIHQVGIFTTSDEESEKYYLRITKQILCTPNIGDVEAMAQSFRDLKEYLLAILEKNFVELTNSDLSVWKNYTTVIPRSETDSAEEFWFSKKESALSDFTKTVSIIREDAESKTRTMIDMLDGSIVLLGTDIFLQGEITTYKKYPYLLSMKTSITEGKDGISKINTEKAERLCLEWNGQIHLSPLRFVMTKDDGNHVTVSIIMTGLFADDCNTRTYVDFLCTLQKATSQLMTLVEED